MSSNTETDIIKTTEITVPSWVLYTLLQHTELCWETTKLTIPQAEIAIQAYRLGSQLLRQKIEKEMNSVKVETKPETGSKLETIPEETSLNSDSVPKPKTRKPKKK